MNNTAAAKRQRDYLFDNYKAFLIALVVISHFIEPAYGNNGFLGTVKWLIVSFHMPAFIFISGYFSKRNLTFPEIFRKLAVPYLVYEVVYYLFYTFITHKETGLYLLYPKFSLWYLLGLFVWRAVTPYVKRIPHYMLLSVAAGLLIGFWSGPSNFLSIPRILFFYPFFLAGTCFERGKLSALRTQKNRLIAAAGIVGFTLFLALAPIRGMYSPKIFYGRYNYDFLKQTAAEGILCRLLCYGIGFVLTFAFMLLMSERQIFCSYIGMRTMAVYLFHGLTYTYLKDCTAILKNTDTIPESLALMAFCVLLVWIFSIPQLTAFTNRIADLRLSRFLDHLRPDRGCGYSLCWVLSHVGHV